MSPAAAITGSAALAGAIVDHVVVTTTNVAPQRSDLPPTILVPISSLPPDPPHADPV
jgi:hypothetical protein